MTVLMSSLISTVLLLSPSHPLGCEARERSSHFAWQQNLFSRYLLSWEVSYFCFSSLTEVTSPWKFKHGKTHFEHPRKLVPEEELPWYWHIHRKSTFNKTFGEFGFWGPCFEGFSMRFSEEITILKSFYTLSVAQKPQKQLFQRPTDNCQKWGEKWSH